MKSINNINEIKSQIYYGVYRPLSKFIDEKNKKTYFILDKKSTNFLKDYIKKNFNIENLKIPENFIIEVTNLKFLNSLKLQTDLQKEILINKYYYNNNVLLFKVDNLLNYNDNFFIAAIKENYILEKEFIIWKNMENLKLTGYYIVKNEK